MAESARPGGQVRIAPSILSADFGALAAEVESVTPEADLIHVDCMDAHFVDNLTIGPVVVEGLRRHTDYHLDCHLMLSDPLFLLEDFVKAGADNVTVHVEIGDPRPCFEALRQLGCGVGLSLNPPTPFESVVPYLGEIDRLLVMSVNPGRGGQAFMPEALPKLREARRVRAAQGLDFEIEVDGGVHLDTAAQVVDAGAEILVAGSAIFGPEDHRAALNQLRAAAKQG
jgi:ribulose-phosphate 3-epimerase